MKITNGALAALINDLLCNEQCQHIFAMETMESLMDELAAVVCKHCGGQIVTSASYRPGHDASEPFSARYVLEVQPDAFSPEGGGVWAEQPNTVGLVEHLRKELRAYANPPGFGTIWQIADSKIEATEWATQYLARGARSVKIEPHADGSSTCDVLVVLPRDKAEQILGTQPGDEEWLDEPDFGAGAAVPQAKAAPPEPLSEFVSALGDFTHEGQA